MQAGTKWSLFALQSFVDVDVPELGSPCTDAWTPGCNDTLGRTSQTPLPEQDPRCTAGMRSHTRQCDACSTCWIAATEKHGSTS
jgi:hypothetical protein